MRAKNLALRVLSTAAMLSIVTSIAAPAFAATYYINEGSVDVNVSDAGVVTVNQGNKTYTDTLDSVVIRGGTRSEGEKDDRTEAGASPATQEADGSNAPAGNETEAPKSENTTGDAAPKQETTAAGERKEGTPQQEPTEEEEEEEEQQEQQEPTEEKVTPELVKAKPEAPKAAQKPSAEHLALTAVAACAAVLASVTAGLAALGLVLKAARCVELLLTSSPNKLLAAVFAN